MNQAIIDNTLLALAFTIALLITRFTKERTTSAISSFFLLFAPFIIFLNMWAHIVAVLIVNYQRYLAGNFLYNFYFYGLLLFGIVFIVVSGFNIHCARKRIKGDVSQQSTIHWMNLATVLLFFPLMFVNPIALLPVIASVVSSVTLWLMKPFTSTLIYNKHNSKHSAEISKAEVTI